MRSTRVVPFQPWCLGVLGLVFAVGCSATQTAGSTGEGPEPSATIEPLSDGDPDLEKAKALIEQQKYADAIPVLEKVVARDPKNAEALGTLGLAYDATGKLDDAEKHYKQALALDPKLVGALQNLGALYVNMDPPKATEAVELLRKAHEVDPGSVPIIRNLALAYAELGDVEKSSKAYEAALKLSDEGAIHYEYAAMLLGAKKSSEALEELKKAAAKTDDPAILASIANTFGMAKAFDQCVATLDKAIAKTPDAKFYMGRGECKHAQKDEKAANADFQKALELDPKSAQGHFYMAMSLIELKKTDEAKAELKKVCELDASSKACDNAKKVQKKNGW